jgi:hypothetical protein
MKRHLLLSAGAALGLAIFAGCHGEADDGYYDDRSRDSRVIDPEIRDPMENTVPGDSDATRGSGAGLRPVPGGSAEGLDGVTAEPGPMDEGGAIDVDRDRENRPIPDAAQEAEDAADEAADDALNRGREVERPGVGGADTD